MLVEPVVRLWWTELILLEEDPEGRGGSPFGWESGGSCTRWVAILDDENDDRSIAFVDKDNGLDPLVGWREEDPGCSCLG